MYHIAHVPAAESLLVDFVEVPGKELTKSLMKDLNRIAERTKSRAMYAGLKADASGINSIVRSMMVYGFEIAGKGEAEKLVSGKNMLVMKLEVTQELDFVDLN
eukprot:TRINITY_DN3135_c0_g1_i17.p3 TRINITY_DN3135_c0_g1~~TRINITY_DN3135_c0_g1_i17.p3  ORF type:complete len:103 (-),score=28.30 TRINITY_DN3135_c0_g1_i17:210-518(-)